MDITLQALSNSLENAIIDLQKINRNVEDTLRKIRLRYLIRSEEMPEESKDEYVGN